MPRPSRLIFDLPYLYCKGPNWYSSLSAELYLPSVLSVLQTPFNILSADYHGDRNSTTVYRLVLKPALPSDQAPALKCPTVALLGIARCGVVPEALGVSDDEINAAVAEVNAKRASAQVVSQKAKALSGSSLNFR